MSAFIFAGTPIFSAIHLEALLQAGFEIQAVLTQPDRPFGRGKTLQASPVKQLALQHNIPVLQPASLNNTDIQETLKALKPQCLIVVAYGLIVPEAVLNIPKKGCLNVHASLLPRFRGAAPIQRAILEGDTQTGICLMQMEKGLDTGPVFVEKTCPITPEDTAETVHDKLAALGANTLVHALPAILKDATPTPQPETGVTYAHKLTKAEARIDWTQPATHIERLVRAFYPKPGAWFEYESKAIRVLSARVVPGTAAPGEVMQYDANLFVVGTGEQCLCIETLQKPGKKPMAYQPFFHGNPNWLAPKVRLP